MVATAEIISPIIETILKLFGGIAAITISYICFSIWIQLRKERRLERIERTIERIKDDMEDVRLMTIHRRDFDAILKELRR